MHTTVEMCAKDDVNAVIEPNLSKLVKTEKWTNISC